MAVKTKGLHPKAKMAFSVPAFTALLGVAVDYVLGGHVDKEVLRGALTMEGTAVIAFVAAYMGGASETEFVVPEHDPGAGDVAPPEPPLSRKKG